MMCVCAQEANVRLHILAQGLCLLLLALSFRLSFGTSFWKSPHECGRSVHNDRKLSIRIWLFQRTAKFGSLQWEVWYWKTTIPSCAAGRKFFAKLPEHYTFAHEVPGQSLASSSECKASNWKMGASSLNTAMEIGDINMNHSQMSVFGRIYGRIIQ